ncbi:cuticle protein 19.8, partial [Diaphorina citri]|uniref:Cuticle protein 19.8 n=1 Tax=Diaphorina citri TaxID=121845 RepID=A0A1S3DSV7_DIACI
PAPKADPAYLAAAPVVYTAPAPVAAVPVAHSYSSVSQYTSHPVPLAKAAPVIATPYIAAPSAPAAVYTYPAYHHAPAVGSVYNYPYVLV